MKGSLERGIQRSPFSISGTRGDTSASTAAQRSYEASQRTADAASHGKNWLQSVSS